MPYLPKHKVYTTILVLVQFDITIIVVMDRFLDIGFNVSFS